MGNHVFFMEAAFSSSEPALSGSFGALWERPAFPVARSSCPVKAVEAPLKNGEKYGIMGASAVQNLPPEERMGRTDLDYGIPRRA